jgi:C-terminal processing protease CtpA/Prc
MPNPNSTPAPRLIAWVVAIVAAVGCGHAARPSAPRFDVEPWLEDYLQLRQALSAGYANLEWAIERREIDPFALNERTLQALRRSRNARDALWALLEFVAVFADPHLQIDVDAHPVHGIMPRYPLRLRDDMARVVVRELDTASAPGCRLRPGDEIVSVAGKPIAGEVRRFSGLVRSIDEDAVIAGALHLILRSSFTPRDGLTVTGLRGSEPVSCWFTPIATGTSPSPATAGELTTVPWTAAAETVCERLGFEEQPAAFAYPLPPGAVPVTRASDAFPAAVLTTPGGRRIGFLRIASFQEAWQHGACVVMWNHLRERQTRPDCDRDCIETFVDFAVRQAIVQQVAAAVEALKAHGVAALVVDILHNGGGNDWAEDVALMLSPREPACNAMAVIRHPHWSRRFAEDVREYEAAIGRGDLDGDERSLITRARDQARHMLAETRATCDLRPLWTEPDHRPACSLIARSDGHLCGADKRRLYQIMDRQGAPALIWDERAPAVGVYTGPLFVLVDRHTASASEQFLSHLKTAGRSIVIGQRTAGAGCGYTNGGLDVVLENSGLRIKMPDCVRYLHGGENEVAGISPDIPLATRDFESPDFLARVLAALDEALAHGS